MGWGGAKWIRYEYSCRLAVFNQTENGSAEGGSAPPEVEGGKGGERRIGGLGGAVMEDYGNWRQTERVVVGGRHEEGLSGKDPSDDTNPPPPTPKKPTVPWLLEWWGRSRC